MLTFPLTGFKNLPFRNGGGGWSVGKANSAFFSWGIAKKGSSLAMSHEKKAQTQSLGFRYSKWVYAVVIIDDIRQYLVKDGFIIISIDNVFFPSVS